MFKIGNLNPAIVKLFCSFHISSSFLAARSEIGLQLLKSSVGLLLKFEQNESPSHPTSAGRSTSSMHLLRSVSIAFSIHSC